jgi:hypothetical protein
MEMSRIRSFAAAGFAVALMLAVTSPANAQTDKNASYSGAVTGAVTAVSETSITVKGANDDGGTFAVTKDTQIMSGGKTIDTGDLDTEDRVVVSWDYAAPNSDKKVAKLIEKADAP